MTVTIKKLTLVTIFTLIEELYEGTEFAGTEQMVSGIFLELNLITEQIIQAEVIQ